MDERMTPQPEIMPQSTQPPNYGPVHTAPQAPAQPPKAAFNIPPVAIIAGVVIVLIIGSILFATGKKQDVVVAPTPTPTNTPTPTPIRALSPFATQSAFLQFETAVTSLPGTIQGASIQDPTIDPPVLDLPLGFSN
jgi:hypothetical protein